MNKAQLIEAIATGSDLSKTAATRALDAFLDAVKGALTNGESVALVGFGTFAVKHRAARVGRNPKTGEEIRIEAKNVPAFNAGKELKEAVAEAEIAAEA